MTPPTSTVIVEEEVPLAVIEDEDVPLARLPRRGRGDLIDIFDEDVPLAGLPKTGDYAPSTKSLLGVMAMSFLGAVGLVRKKKNPDSKK